MFKYLLKEHLKSNNTQKYKEKYILFIENIKINKEKNI